MIENGEYFACARLFRAILHRAFDDLSALCSGLQVPSGDGARELDEAERIALLEDVLDWFFSDRPAPCSLDVCCQALGLTVDRQRARAQKIVDGEGGKMRRVKLRPDQIEEIRAALAAGQTTKELGARFRVDPSAIRKVRIRLRRRAAA